MSNSKEFKACKSLFYTVFSTSWGPVGAAAGQRGISRVILPHYKTSDLIDLLERDHPSAQRNDKCFETFSVACQVFFQGRPADFLAVECELPPLDSFSGKVLLACRAIPPGQTQSYGELARKIDNPKASRAVSMALSRNRIPLLVPCHRVIYSTGKPGGFSAEGGRAAKLRLLQLEKNA